MHTPTPSLRAKGRSTNGSTAKNRPASSAITDKLETELQDLRGKIAAIGKSQAVIEFKLDGTVLTANENFLNTLGYSLAEIQGQHHSIFVEPAYRASNEYRQFWRDLADGK